MVARFCRNFLNRLEIMSGFFFIPIPYEYEIVWCMALLDCKSVQEQANEDEKEDLYFF